MGGVTMAEIKKDESKEEIKDNEQLEKAVGGWGSSGKVCPNCGSTDTFWTYSTACWNCDKCGHFW